MLSASSLFATISFTTSRNSVSEAESELDSDQRFPGLVGERGTHPYMVRPGHGQAQASRSPLVWVFPDHRLHDTLFDF